MATQKHDNINATIARKYGSLPVFPPPHAPTGPQQGAAAMKDVEWSTWTLPFGWAARGVWPVAGSDRRMNVTCTKRSGDATLLAAGDNFG